VSKSHRTDKEYTKEQRLVFENKKLKREVSSLRKQLARLDLDRYSQVRDIIDEHYKEEEKSEQTQDLLKSLKEEWKCRECESGFLEIFTYERAGTTWYFRRCSEAPFCKNRTKGQPYTPNVKGIIKSKPNKNG